MTGPLALIVRLALRSLRGGLRGFGIFFACIALGVATVSGIGSLASGIADGLARDGRVILGGDVSFGLSHRELNGAEAAYLRERGNLSSIAVLRSMARTAGNRSTLAEIKAVDAAYPTGGRVLFVPAPGQPAPELQKLLAPQSGISGAVIDRQLALRLDLKPGDTLMLGEASVEVRAILESEPDKLAGGMSFGPRILLSQDALRQTGLLMEGSLVRWTYRLAVNSPTQAVSDATVTNLIAQANGSFPEAGWEVRTRDSISPQFSRSMARLAQFLSLVGLTALAAGGAGVGSAVAAHVARKRADIATLKALGAPAATIFAGLLAEIALLALLGTIPGMLLGAALPFALAKVLGTFLPFPLVATLYPAQLAIGATFGLIVALLFALPALGRAHDVPVSGLFRYQITPGRTRLRKRYWVMIGAVAVALLGLTWMTAADQRLALVFLGAAAGIFLVLRLGAGALMAIARRLPHPRNATLRLALASIHRPGTLTPSIFVSLGLSLSLLTALALVDSSLRQQFVQALPRQSPSFFFLDIPSRDASAFETFLHAQSPGAKIEQVALMRGRVMEVNGQKAEDVKAKESAAWVLEGDRGITTAATPPEGSSVSSGTWWAADYAGPPLVSLDEAIADGLHLKLGDSITVNVLGRNVTASIASLRKINWRSMGINFVLVFSPGSFRGAPFSTLASLAYPAGFDALREETLLKSMAQDWPNITAVRVKDTFDALTDLFDKIGIAVRAASAIVIAAAVLALAGALAASQETRNRDAVVLKVLGAGRGKILRIFLAEYALLGAVAAGFGLAAGALAAWAVCKYVMEIDFAFAPLPTLGMSLAAVVLMIGLGLTGSWRILGRKPPAICARDRAADRQPLAGFDRRSQPEAGGPATIFPRRPSCRAAKNLPETKAPN